MRAIIFEDYGGPDVLREALWPDPQPGKGEVRIRVRAAGVNPVDFKIRRGYLKDRLPNQLRLHQVAGRGGGGGLHSGRFS